MARELEELLVLLHEIPTADILATADIKAAAPVRYGFGGASALSAKRHFSATPPSTYGQDSDELFINAMRLLFPVQSLRGWRNAPGGTGRHPFPPGRNCVRTDSTFGYYTFAPRKIKKELRIKWCVPAFVSLNLRGRCSAPDRECAKARSRMAHIVKRGRSDEATNTL